MVHGDKHTIDNPPIQPQPEPPVQPKPEPEPVPEQKEEDVKTVQQPIQADLNEQVKIDDSMEKVQEQMSKLNIEEKKNYNPPPENAKKEKMLENPIKNPKEKPGKNDQSTF